MPKTIPDVVVRTHTYPLHPTPAQAEQMALWFDQCRWLWNQAVEMEQDRSKAWARFYGCGDKLRRGRRLPSMGWSQDSLRAGVTIHDKTFITAARGIPDSPIEGVPGVWAAGAIHQLVDGWTMHWSKLKSGEKSSPPGFRSRHRGQSVRMSVQMSVDGKSVAPDVDRIVRPRESGRFSDVRVVGSGMTGPLWVKARMDRSLPEGATCGSMIVRCDDRGKWWVSFQCRQPAAVRELTGVVLGVDRGVTHTVATDQGDMYSIGPAVTEGEARRKRKLQRQQARARRTIPCPADRWVGKKVVRGRCECEQGVCWKQSNRYKDRADQLLKQAERESNRRGDGSHKISATLAAQADVVVFEDLKITNMVRSAAGTVDEPGVNVAAKSGLNRAILGQHWGQIRSKTAYKTHTADVPAAYSSQTCAACQHVSSDSRDGEKFACVECGHVDHADVNAAKVIRARWISERH